MLKPKLKRINSINLLISLIIICFGGLYPISSSAEGCKPSQCPTTCSANLKSDSNKKMDAGRIVNKNNSSLPVSGASYLYYSIDSESDYSPIAVVNGKVSASLSLGAGRNKLGDKIDYGAGILLKKKVGERVKKGETIAVMFSSDESKFREGEEIIKKSTFIGKNEVKQRDIIIEIIE